MNQGKLSTLIVLFLLVVFLSGAILGYSLIASEHMPNLPKMETTADKDAPAIVAIFLVPFLIINYFLGWMFFILYWLLGLCISFACGIGALSGAWLLIFFINSIAKPRLSWDKYGKVGLG
jgi:hypothetical protein